MTRLEFAPGQFVFNTMAVTLKRAGAARPLSGKAAEKADANKEDMRRLRTEIDYNFRKYCARLSNGYYTVEAGLQALRVELAHVAEKAKVLNDKARALGAPHRLTTDFLRFPFDPDIAEQVEELRHSVVERLGDLFVCLKTGDLERKGRRTSKDDGPQFPLDSARQRASKLELVVDGETKQLVVEALAEAAAAASKLKTAVSAGEKPELAGPKLRLPALKRAIEHFGQDPNDLLGS